jgi:hypothetical protein
VKTAALFLCLAVALLAPGGGCSSKTAGDQQRGTAHLQEGDEEMLRKLDRVEAACGQCQFGLPGDGCDLAVRIDGTAYFVDGTHIDAHGDAHARDGFCNTVRHASVEGRIEGGRFVVRSFQLLPEESE